ncbi:MAG TPA: hypothetical protein VHY58_15015 [Streptosporangiaceae bacterium]|jgi:hypothetical protein|nr:hypothetical protein [Streptosporangiaceae bacterium]
MPPGSLSGQSTGTDAGLGDPVTADRAALTASYLDEVARRGGTADDLRAVMPTRGRLWAAYKKRWIPRPLFLGEAEADQVNSDLQHVKAAMASLPGQLYDGDLAAFARAAGLAEVQADALMRVQPKQLTDWARADMYPDPQGLRLMEFNVGSTIGGSECGEIARSMLRYPPLREFARAHRLGYVSAMPEQIRRTFEETGLDRADHPMIALVDTPAHYHTIGAYLHQVSRYWRGIGLDAHACHIGQLKVRNGRVWLRGRPVDIIFRIFLLEHLLEPDGPEVVFPLLDAVARGQVAMFTPMDADLYSSKAVLAMVSDHANRHLFTPAQQTAIDRVLPWTRMLRPGPVTLEDGSTVDLAQYAFSHPQDLVLKPALLHGGIGVLPGWDSYTTEGVWREALKDAMGGPYVLQRRIEVIPELAPGEDGKPFGWETTWGFFTSPDGFGGVWARAFPAQQGHGVARAGSGLLISGALVQRPEAPAQA